MEHRNLKKGYIISLVFERCEKSMKKVSLVSYTLATMAGLCFVSGLVILSNGGGN